MKIESFFERSEFLYHLTDRRNWDIIRGSQTLRSTVELVNDSNLTVDEKESLLYNRRPYHVELGMNGTNYYLRDQRPISLKNLGKCLTNNWSVGDFLYHLNRRVFFWPNIHRLQSHYGRYVDEYPIIIKVDTRQMIGLNNHAEYCRLNSGATRSNSYLGGAPPARGIETFLPIGQYPYTPASVAEVTFPNNCTLPDNIYIGESPQGPWTEVNLASD